MTTASIREDEAPDELDDVLAEIAELIATISSFEDLPGIVERTQAPHSQEEIAARDSPAWLAALINEQGWLNLNSTVTHEHFVRAPMSAAASLFSAMGLSETEARECFGEGPLGPALTSFGAGELVRRLAAADRCAKRCRSLSTPGGSERCQEEWEQAWSEENVDDNAQPTPITAKSDTWSIAELASKADRGQLVLNPTYQRDDVWKLSDRSMLIESILRGIPLPSIVLLEVPRAGKKPAFEVVDGKQRITSILRFIGRHPRAIEKAKELAAKHNEPEFVDSLKHDYRKFVRLWKKHEGQKLSSDVEREFMLPFKLNGGRLRRIESLRGCVGKYFTDIRDVSHTEDSTVEQLFTETVDYRLLVITFSKTDPRQIHDVFQLYNRQGMHLNAEEIRNAVFHDLTLTRAILGAGREAQDVDRLLSGNQQGSQKLRDAVTRIAARLDSATVPSDRYRRTKLFAWVIATVFALRVRSGKFVVMSTAKQIDEMLLKIRDARGDCWEMHAARNTKGLEDLFEALDGAVRVLDEEELFDARFKTGGSGQRWQDLPFVAALGALLIARLTLGEAFDERVAQCAASVDRASTGLKRDRKSQNWTQWRYIGRSICAFLEALNLSHADISSAFQRQFRHDPMVALVSARDQPDPE
jgi:hypothetical protein